MELLNKACTGKNAYSCYYISGIFIQGVKDLIDKDMTKAFQYSLKACDLGNMYACANVSQVNSLFDCANVAFCKRVNFAASLYYVSSFTCYAI